jgi:PKD repeat protein
VLGPDDVGLTLVSNASFSASRPEVGVTLPGPSNYDAGSLDAFWVGFAVSGVPCSLDAQSILRIEFLPPSVPGGSGPSSDWQVRAPVWDLVAPGSCDPQCQNSSALYEIGGSRFCEDDAVLRGANARDGSADALLIGGDTVRVELGGGGGSPLTVYLNDTTHAGQSSSWQYPGALLVSGDPLGPWSSVATASAGWTPGGLVDVGWTNCPVVNASLPGVPCNSYQGGSLSGVDYPRLSNSSFWNPSAHAFNAPYTLVETWSTSGACLGAPASTACTDFRSSGGEGAYPKLSLDASNGSAWIGYGANASALVSPIASSTSGFANGGAPTSIDPGLVTDLAANVTPTSITISARATDPRGIAYVELGALWCFNPASSVPSFFQIAASEGSGPSNGSQDGSFFATFPRGSNTTIGALSYVARVYDSYSAPGGPPVDGRTSIPGTGAVCGEPAGPTPSVLSATVVGAGYRVNWTFPAPSDELVRNYSVIARPTLGGPAMVLSVPGPDARSATITVLPGATYVLYVGATFLDGVTMRSTGADGLATLPPFGFTDAVSNLTLWEPNATESVQATLTGGVAPYCLIVVWGDGTNATDACGSSTTPIATHDYAGYFGVGRLWVSATDGAGDVANATAVLVDVRATPLGVAVTVLAGDGLVDVNWTTPPSPSGPVTGYVVYFTTDPVAASELTIGWPSNITGPHPVFLRNTTAHSLEELPVADGATFFVEVVAWDRYGSGLVGSAGPSEGRPAPLTVAFTPAPSGGPAPYETLLNATVTSGSPNAITQAVFYATPGPSSAANVTTIGGESWVNGSYNFARPGLYALTVHVVDALLESDAATVDVYVGPGEAPLVSVGVLTPTPYAGRPVDLEATVTQGTGPYLFSWSFGDGAVATDAGAMEVHTYASAGTTTVAVTVTDNATDASSVTYRTFTVYADPSVAIVASTGGSGGLSFDFRALVDGGSGPSVIAWTFGDGSTATGANASHVYANPGTYTVNVTATDPTGLKATSSLSVYAGVPKASTPFLGGPGGVDLLAVAIVLIVLLAGTAGYFFLRSRRAQAIEVERTAEPMYGTEVRPSPPELPPPQEGPGNPPEEPT